MHETEFYGLNGQQPDILNQECQGLYLMQFQEDGVLTDQANSAYLQFSGQWHHLCFDGSTIFWRKQNSHPNKLEPVNACLSWASVLHNLCALEGVIGHVLNDIRYDGDEHKIMAEFIFSSSNILSFTHHKYPDDYTTVNLR